MYKPTAQEIAAKEQEYRALGLRYYTPSEELWNTLTHAVGALYGIVMMCVMLCRATAPMQYLAAVIFGLSTLAVYGISAWYHGTNKDLHRKAVIRKLDHSSINLIISACGIGLCFLTSGRTVNYVMLGICYGITAVGFILCLSNLEKNKGIAFALNFVVAAALVTVFFINREYLDWTMKGMYIAGSVFCLTGAILYRTKGRFVHTVFHVAVVIGTVFYSVAILLLF